MLHAVVVGINSYRDPKIHDLSYARADAEEFGRLLNDGIDPAERSVRLIVDSEATKQNLMIAIGEDLPRKSSAEDVIVLFFAGHGSPETGYSPDQSSRYLVAHDTEYDSIYATGIDMERELPRWYARMQEPKLILLFVDTCFSGRAGGRTFEGPHLLRERCGTRRMGAISLKKLDLGEGRLMMSACDDDEVAREDSSIGHGVFSYYLLKALRGDGKTAATISLNSLYDDISQAVRLHTEGRQVPIFNGRSRAAMLPRFILRSES